MRSDTRLRLELAGDGSTRVAELRAEVPQLARVTSPGGPGRTVVVHLLGGGAGPLGGDRCTFTLDVGPGARVEVRSVAATMVHPGALGAPSESCAHVRVGAGASLRWWPEPMVAVQGCHHQVRLVLEAAADADVTWVDEVVLGRSDEPGGRLVLHQRVLVDARPVLHHEVDAGPHHTGIGVHGPFRVLTSAVALAPAAAPGPRTVPGPTIPPVISPTVRAARIPVGPGVTAWLAAASSVDAARAALTTLAL